MSEAIASWVKAWRHLYWSLAPAGLFQELLGDGGLERREHDRLVGLGHVHQQPVVERAAEHGRRPQHLDLLRLEPAQPQEHRLAHRLRHPQHIVRAPPPSGLGLEDLATVEGLPQHLLEHERVPLRVGVDERDEVGTHLLGVQDRPHHLGDVSGRHGRHGDRLREPSPAPDLDDLRQGVAPVELVAAMDREQHHPAPDEAPGDVVQQLARRAVGPVDVVEHQHQTPIAGPQVEQRHERLEEPLLGLRRIPGGRSRRPVRELREQLRQLSGRRAELDAQGGGVGLVEAVPHRLDERQVRERELRFGAAAPQDVEPQLARPAGQLGGQAGLPDSGLPGEQDEPPVTPVGREQRVLELRQLLLPSDQHRGDNPLEHPAILPGPPGSRSGTCSPPALGSMSIVIDCL